MKKQVYQCDLLIFDLDGTLVDTVSDLAQSVNYSLRSLGFKEQSFEHITGYIGDGVRKLLNRAFGSEDAELIQKALEIFRDHYRIHICDFSKPYPGIEKILDIFRNKKLSVLTNKTQEFADELLKELGFYDRFDLIIGGGAGYAYKPDPESIHVIMEKLCVTPDKTMIVGDSPNDIKAGKQALLKTCAVSYGYNSRQVLQECDPDIIITHPEALLQHVR